MKVGLGVDYLSVERGTGIARYSQEILNGLRVEGIELEVISLMPFRIPFGEAFNHTVRLPYYILKKARNFDLIHATAPITGLCFPFVKKPKVITYHDIGSFIYKDSGASFHVRISAPFFFKIGKHADKVIAVSTQTKEELVTYLSFPEDKIVVINPGIREEFRAVEKSEERDYYTVGYVGALAQRKRIDHIIRAIYFLRKKYPELKVKLFIYGKGNDFQRLNGIVSSLKLEKYVEFKGFVPEEKLVEVYNSFDVFVLPSEWEGFGIPILEAQRCGVQVVIREDAHIPEEASRYCIKASSEQDMAEKIYEILINPSLRQALVQKGLEYSKGFTWEKTVEETIKAYKGIL